MKKVNKVSISGLSFTVDEEAHSLIRSYLDTLSAHYSSNPNGGEIIEGIEGRMAELFIDRGGKSGVVTSAMVREVIGIIGSPEEIFGEDASRDGGPDAAQDSAAAPLKKRLYRNPAGKKISGVCGGLGVYFGIDPIWLRLFFTGMTILAAFTTNDFWNPFLFLALYGILWICMPPALTTRQKCEMYGKTLSYNDIEREVENRREYEKDRRDGSGVFSAILKILGIFFGIIFAVVGISGIIALVAVLLGLSVAGLAIPAVVTNILASIVGMPVWMAVLLKVLAVIAVTMPFVGLLYCGIALIFKFRAPVWRTGLVLLLIWVASLVGICSITLVKTVPYWHSDNVTTGMSLDSIGDTLHVQFTGLDEWKDDKIFVKGDEDDFELAYVDVSDRKSPRVAVYPSIDLNRTDVARNAELSFENYSGAVGECRATQAELCRVSSDTLFVSPVIYGGGHGFDKADMSLEINLPDNVKVVIDAPVAHSFEKEVSYTNVRDGRLGRELMEMF